MTKPESDLEMIGRIYREQVAATKQHSLTYHADVSEQTAKEMVACLITAAIEACFVWPNTQWWEE